ncbi:glycosyltransferase family 20-domain-containing protein [Phycomyces blakesleeanus]
MQFPSLTADKVAVLLPLAGNPPKIPGRIINVSHKIPYNIIRASSTSPPSHVEFLSSNTPSPPASPLPRRHGNVALEIQRHLNKKAGIKDDVVQDAVEAAPVSKLARHHHRSRTLRAKFYAADWTVEESRDHAALHAGIQSLRRSWETIHIGWTGPIKVKGSKKDIQPEAISEEDKKKLGNLLWETGNIVPIFLDNKSRGHYEGYCKEVLWPLFHYIVWTSTSDGRAEKQNWEDYVAVNQQFADTIIGYYRPGDIIFIQDYHLLLVPQMIRAKLPDAAVGIFLHATFPSSEIFRCLTTRNEILRGILGANLVGFQTYSYARHFISSSTRVLGCESTLTGVDLDGHVASVDTFPIGIDANRVHKFRKEPGVLPKMNAIREMYADKKIIIGRDKLDSTKGVLQKLHAFEKFLRDYPEWRNKVVLIQVTTPTHGDHSKLENKVSEIISHVNGLYGSLEFTPIHHYHQNIDRDEYYALLSVADVGMITSVRDGMNTTSLEYIICQYEKHGPLVLSEFTGTAGSLSAALLVNPFDYAGVAKALNDSLTMSADEKATRHQQLYSQVIKHSASFWANSFVKHLVSSTEERALQSHEAPVLDTENLVREYKAAKKRLLLFDYDGTLTRIVSVPKDAKPSPEMLSYLQTLCDDPLNEVWIVSGRDQSTLVEWLGEVKGLNLSAEHGCFSKPQGAKTWANNLTNVDMSWQQDVTEIFDYYTERTQGSFVEHKKSSITWHYRLADVVYGAFQAKECQNHLENAVVSKLPVEILVGKKNLEVRPLSINKGEIVKKILAQNPDADFVMCAGDDKTDEDMFKVLSAAQHMAVSHQQQLNKQENSGSPKMVPVFGLHVNTPVYSIAVGPAEKKSMANWHVRTSDDVVNALGRLATTLGK